MVEGLPCTGVCIMGAVLLWALRLGLGWAWVACGILRWCAVTCVLMGVECWLLCVVRRMFDAQVCRVVRWLFGFGVVCLLVVLIVPLFLSFLAMPGLCCFIRVTRRNLQTPGNAEEHKRQDLYPCNTVVRSHNSDHLQMAAWGCSKKRSEAHHETPSAANAAMPSTGAIGSRVYKTLKQ